MTSFANNFCVTSEHPPWDGSVVGQCGANFAPLYVLSGATGGPQIDLTPKNLATSVHGSYADAFVHSHPQLIGTGVGGIRAVSDGLAARIAGPTAPYLSRNGTGGSTLGKSTNPLVHGDGGIHMAPATATPFVCDGATSVQSTVQGVINSRAYDLTLRPGST